MTVEVIPDDCLIVAFFEVNCATARIHTKKPKVAAGEPKSLSYFQNKKSESESEKVMLPIFLVLNFFEKFVLFLFFSVFFKISCIICIFLLKKKEKSHKVKFVFHN